MAIAAKRVLSAATKDPLDTPVNTAVLKRPLTEHDLRLGTMICGDDFSGRDELLMNMIEDKLDLGERAIFFTRTTSSFGLVSRYPMVRIGRNTHGMSLTGSDGAALAALVMGSADSYVFDLGGMDNVQTSRLLRDFINALLTVEYGNLNLYFRMLDSILLRKRHRDAATATAFQNLLQMGPLYNLRTAITTIATTEVPQENNKRIMTMIATRISKPENVESFSKATDSRIYDLVDTSVSISLSRNVDAWVWAYPTRPRHMPHYLRIRPIKSDARHEAPIPSIVSTEKETAAAIAILSARKTDEKEETEQKIAQVVERARIRESARVISQSLIHTKAPGSCKSTAKRNATYAHVEAAGYKNVVYVDLICRSLIPMPDGRSRHETGLGPKVVEMADSRPGVVLAAQYMRIVYQRSRPLTERVATLTTIGAAHLLAHEKNAASAGSFFSDLAANGPSADLAKRLAAFDDAGIPLKSVERRDALVEAAVSHGAAPAANDDDSLSAAV